MFLFIAFTGIITDAGCMRLTALCVIAMEHIERTVNPLVYKSQPPSFLVCVTC